MGKNVTYLLGAGASAGKLPVIGNMADRINKLTFLLYQMYDYRYDKEHLKLIDALKHLEVIARTHSSVDTYAKKLFLQQSKELNFFKIILSSYLTLEQLVNGVDLRYDSFFASILKKHTADFPDDIKIISWNYDYQFEQSYSGFHQNSDVWSIRQALSYKDDNINTGNTYAFEFIKLNGSAGTYYKNDETVMFSKQVDTRFCSGNTTFNYMNEITSISEICFAIDNIDAYKSFVDTFYDLVTNADVYSSNLKFAWEPQSRISKYAGLISDTDILVIIGYSFPYFNREVDRILFGNQNMKRLSKIYIQDISPEKIGLSFKSIRPNIGKNFVEESVISIDYINDVGQFFIPYEM